MVMGCQLTYGHLALIAINRPKYFPSRWCDGSVAQKAVPVAELRDDELIDMPNEALQGVS